MGSRTIGVHRTRQAAQSMAGESQLPGRHCTLLREPRSQTDARNRWANQLTAPAAGPAAPFGRLHSHPTALRLLDEFVIYATLRN
jgi:hypothetical protein